MRIAAARLAVRQRLPGPCRHLRRPLRGAAGAVHGRRGQGVAGHRHGRAGDGAHDARPGARGVAAGLRNHGAGRVDRRSDLDGRAVLRGDRTPSFRPARWPRRCAGRRPSSTWPTATRPKATSFSGRRWRWRWHRAAPPGGRWAVRGGATTYDRALAMARSADPMSHAIVIAYAYGFAIAGGVLLADDAALRDIEEALEIAERSSEDFALGLARWALGMALVHRDSPAERERGLAVLGQVRDMCLQRAVLPVRASGRRRVHRAGAGQARRPRRCHTVKCAPPIDDLFHAGQLAYGIPATGCSGGDAAGARCRR